MKTCMQCPWTRQNGDACLHVRAFDIGEGITAYVKVYKWFMGTSGMGLSEKAHQIMAPTAPKLERGFAEAVEKWLEGFRLLSNHRGYDMSYKLQVTALKMLMVGRARHHFELWEEEYKADSDDDWKKL